MPIVHRLGFRGTLLAALLGLPAAAHAACSGPPALTAAMHARPSTANAVALGNWFAEQHQFDCAAETFHAGIAVDGQSAQLHYLYALALLANRHANEAIPELKESVRLEPGTLKPHIVLASLYDEAGNHDVALDEWQKAMTIDARDERVLDGLSENLMSREDYRGTIAVLMNAPRTEKLTLRLSKALGLANYLDQAATVLQDGMKQNPRSAALARALATVLVYQHKNAQAIEVLQKAFAEHPNDFDAGIELYQLEVLLGHRNEAAPLRTKLMAARPHDRDVLYLSGILEHLAGNNEEAKKLLTESVSVDPEFFYSRYNLGIVLVALKEWQAAKENLEKAISLGVVEPQAHFELAKALKALGENERAEQELEKYRDMRKDEESGLEARLAVAEGDDNMRDGKFEEAIQNYRQAVDTEPNSALYRYKLSMALHKSGDVANEKKELEETVRLSPTLAGAQSALGYLLAREGDTEGAIAHFRKAVEDSPQWPEAWVNLAAELAVGAHYSEAKETVAKALALDPQDVRAQKLRDQLANDPNARLARP